MSSISLLNPKAEFARAAQALAINISGGKGLQDVSPKGIMKMLVSGPGDIKITTDGNGGLDFGHWLVMLWLKEFVGFITSSRMKTRISFVSIIAILISVQLKSLHGSEIITENSLSAANDFRFISFKDISAVSDTFRDDNVTFFSRLLFDIARDQVIVGARNTIYRLSLRLKLREKASWEATPTLITTCQDKGQSVDDCHNYLMILQNYGDRLYACGTYAFSPKCSWRQMENLTAISYESGVAKCPFNPKANVTSLISDSGYMFIGSPTDFSGSDFAILRSDLAKTGNQLLRTKQYNSKWLNEPQFIGSFESGEFVYFVFREAALESINCGKSIYSRIARVCKRDVGGDFILKDNWTSFLKARLNCSLPGEYPFYFDEVQGISYSAEEDVLYATFSTSQNSMHGSAVCAYNMSAINAPFSGPFKVQKSFDSTWESDDGLYRSQFECKVKANNHTAKHLQLRDSVRYQLMDKSIQPITERPLYHSQQERFVHISIDMIATKHAHRRVPIVYVSTETGLIKKIYVPPKSHESCVIEIWQPAAETGTKIHTIQYLEETESLYVGTDSSLIRIPGQHCQRHVTKASCMNSMDPYCGWNDLKEVCSTAPNGDSQVTFWIQNATMCPLLTAPVDGGWSAWSDWFKCAQNTDQDVDEAAANLDMCLCRRRNCNNPKPKNGGLSCKGIDIVVTNCTVNGGWTEWSAWSGCSQTCGIAVKTRRRTCGNPKPAHGGRTCVGPDREEIYCPHLPPCSVPEEQSVDGVWGPWGSWSECSAPCGGGYKVRRRECNSPGPRNGGLYCPGCHIDYEPCNTHGCPERKKTSTWTPWLVEINGNASKSDERLERRFKFTCRATVPHENLLRFDTFKEEKRVCNPDGTKCQRFNSDSEDSEWTEWGPCSVSCGGGQQIRRRICDGDDCKGKLKMARACNIHPCADWGCWTDWSPCSETCGPGKKFRSRKCLGNNCDGNNREEEMCNMGPCDEESSFRPEMVLQAGQSSLSIYIICPLIAIVSAAISTILTILYYRRQNAKIDRNILPPSNSYGAYPNQYESLPTKDLNERRVKPKRQSSFNSGGTLTKSNNLAGNHTPKVLSKSFTECEPSTLKRNSQLNNARLHRNVDDEKF